jgi:hypothetical protein
VGWELELEQLLGLEKVEESEHREQMSEQVLSGQVSKEVSLKN